MKREPVPHYLIPGTSLELIDVLKLCLTPGEFQSCLWFSLGQYWFRGPRKGDGVGDMEKAVVYATWLRDSFKEHGVCMGKP
jgi:hypothetical protein